jgi:hypothetical protein
VSLSQLRRWNNIPSGTRVDPGRRLRVAEPVPVRAAETRRRKTGGQAESSTGKPGAASKPGGSTSKAARSQAAKPAAHTGTSTTHKPASRRKTSQQ